MQASGLDRIRVSSLCTALLLVGGAGCTRTLSVNAHVPNPLGLADARERAEWSYDLTIWIKDNKGPSGLASTYSQAGTPRPDRDHGYLLPAWVEPRQFPQSVLMRAAPDELRFDVALVSEWRELVSLRNYRVELRDDRGLLAAPDDLWNHADTHRDYETTYQVWKNFQTVRVHDGQVSGTYQMWAPEHQWVSERIYRGRGTVVFRGSSILRPDTRSLTLTLTSKARILRFTWIFG